MGGRRRTTGNMLYQSILQGKHQIVMSKALFESLGNVLVWYDMNYAIPILGGWRKFLASLSSMAIDLLLANRQLFQ